MEANEFKNLTNEQLLLEQKKLKTSNLTKAVLIGFFIGIAIYSATKKGFGFFTILPLFFAYLLYKDRKRSKALEDELHARNLNK